MARVKSHLRPRAAARRAWAPPRTDSDAELRAEQLERYSDSPARAEIGGYFGRADAAGVDTTTPEFFEEAFAAGEAEYRARLSAGVATPLPPLLEPNHASHRQVVYYMRMGDLVKIGTSGSIASRIATLNPQGVMAVEWGARPLEKQRHREFADVHSHAEWFRLDERLGIHIAAVRDQFQGEAGQSVESWLAERLELGKGIRRRLA